MATIAGIFLFLLILALFGESAWLIFLCIAALHLGCGRRYPRSLRIVGPVLVAIILVLHAMGYKAYGSAQVVLSPPLKNSLEVVSLNSPSQVGLANGQTLNLSGVYFPRHVDLKYDPVDEKSFWLWHNLRAERNNYILKVQPSEDGRHATCQMRYLYGCGNTFFPTLFPARLPSHREADLGELLVQSGLALPIETKDSVNGYFESLLKRLTSFQNSLYPLSAGIARHDPTAISLGRALATPQSSHFVTGAYILIAAQDTDSYPMIEQETRRRDLMTEFEPNDPASIRLNELTNLLSWVSPAFARTNLLPLKFESSMNGPTWSEGAMILAAHGNLGGIDQAMQHLTDSAPKSGPNYLADSLKHLLHWPANTPGFEAWYRDIRPQLKSGRDESGDLVFWFEGGKPFDKAYLDSMSSVASD